MLCSPLAVWPMVGVRAVDRTCTDTGAFLRGAPTGIQIRRVYYFRHYRLGGEGGSSRQLRVRWDDPHGFIHGRLTRPADRTGERSLCGRESN